ncbi:MAG: hypothetical protein AAGC55_17340, partial [Myxococcota bacterium]
QGTLMKPIILFILILTGCSFNPSVSSDNGDSGDESDSTPDAGPPPTAEVRFVSVTPDVSELRPGQYGIEVTAVLTNELAVPITEVAVSLSFEDRDGSRSGDFYWRDFDRREGMMDVQPTEVAAGGEATFRFKVDALASLAGSGTVEIHAVASFMVEDTERSATRLDPPQSLELDLPNEPIVVNNPADEEDDDDQISLREALQQALETPGLDRIVFDPSVFPPGGDQGTVLNTDLGELPTLDDEGGADIVIDGSGAGFYLALDDSWEESDGRYGLRIDGGNVVIHGIEFRNMGYNYEYQASVETNNCGNGDVRQGGAIWVDKGTLIVDSNTFIDPDVAERNCYAASIRLEGGSGHRILRNRWTDTSMDSLFIDTRMIEVSDNIMDAGSDPDKTDECIYVNSQGGEDLWITGNLCVDQEYSGVIARGDNNGTLYVVNNTFVRNGLEGLSAVRREQNLRPVILRNNVYVSNNPAAINPGNNGISFDIAYEAVVASEVCQSCIEATLDSDSILNPTDLRLNNPEGTTPDDLTPSVDSPLVDSAIDWLDRNGRSPGRYSGQGPERGAVERP